MSANATHRDRQDGSKAAVPTRATACVSVPYPAWLTLHRQLSIAAHFPIGHLVTGVIMSLIVIGNIATGPATTAFLARFYAG